MRFCSSHCADRIGVIRTGTAVDATYVVHEALSVGKSAAVAMTVKQLLKNGLVGSVSSGYAR